MQLTKEELKYICNADRNSKKHTTALENVANRFYDFIGNTEELKFLLKDNRKGMKDIFGYPPTVEKKKFFNDILSRFLIHFQKERYLLNECPYYQPNTMNQKICTLFFPLVLNMG